MGFRQSRLYGEEMPQILAIDDDEVSRKLIRGNLSDIARVSAVVCGRDGLSYLNTGNKVDLILLDYRMPGMTGLEVLKQIKSRDEFREVPVIMFTGEENESLESQALEAGAADFIHKPLVIPVMRQRVMNILNYFYLQHSLQAEVTRQTKLAERRQEEAEQLFEEMIMALAQARALSGSRSMAEPAPCRATLGTEQPMLRSNQAKPCARRRLTAQPRQSASAPKSWTTSGLSQGTVSSTFQVLSPSYQSPLALTISVTQHAAPSSRQSVRKGRSL